MSYEWVNQAPLSGVSGGLKVQQQELAAEDAGDAGSVMLEIHDCSGHVVNAAMKVHSALGPGLLESAYRTCLAYELRSRGLKVVVESPITIVYERVKLPIAYRIDLLVDDHVVVELKTVSELKSIHEAQLLSYLKLSGHPVGLLINFNVVHLRQGIKRMVNQR